MSKLTFWILAALMSLFCHDGTGATQLSGSQIAPIPRTSPQTAVSFDQAVKLANAGQFNANLVIVNDTVTSTVPPVGWLYTIPYFVYFPESIWGLLSQPWSSAGLMKLPLTGPTPAMWRK